MAKRKKGGRISNAEREKKMREGRELYVKGVTVQSIAELLGITAETINKWKRDQDWVAERKMQQISVSEMKKTIMQSFHDLREGREPKFKADEISKLAAAFDKLSDKKKNLAYCYDVLEELTTEISEDIVATKEKEDKAFKLKSLKYIRSVMDRLTSRLYNESLHE